MATDKSAWVVGKVLAQQAHERGDQPFIQYEDGEPYTYAQAHELANRIGNAFGQEGVAFGDPVAVMLHNRLEHLWTWFGLNRLGAVYMGINTAYKGRFLTHVLANGGARWVDQGLFKPQYDYATTAKIDFFSPSGDWLTDRIWFNFDADRQLYATNP